MITKFDKFLNESKLDNQENWFNNLKLKEWRL